MAWDPVWEQVFRSQAWGKYPAEELIRFVARNFYKASNRKDVRILEVGCGPGANLWYLAREGFGFSGIDGSETAIQQAAARLDAECPGWQEYGELRVGDITKLPFETNTFDAVIDNEAISCNQYEPSKQIYSEMARVLKSKGKLFSRTFSKGSWGDATGESVGRGAWKCGEGPLAGKGVVRFTAESEISDLVKDLKLTNVEKLSWTVENQAHSISEWIIYADKG